MSRTPAFLLMLSGLAGLLAGLAGGAAADTVTAPRLHGPALTAAELQACRAQREQLAHADLALQRERDALEQDRAEIERLSQALDVRFARLERDSPASVADFHAALRERDVRIEAHVGRLPAFHARTEAVKGEEAGWTARCADRPYAEGEELPAR